MAKELYKEKMKGFAMENELMQYKALYNLLKDSNPELYPNIINKTKIHQMIINNDLDTEE